MCCHCNVRVDYPDLIHRFVQDLLLYDKKNLLRGNSLSHYQEFDFRSEMAQRLLEKAFQRASSKPEFSRMRIELKSFSLGVTRKALRPERPEDYDIQLNVNVVPPDVLTLVEDALINGNGKKIIKVR